MNIRRSRDASMFGNPVLIGALTVLVTIVAVTLAYNANNGLPFVPRYQLKVQLRNASELTHGGEVHMGGTLVGTVQTVRPAFDSHRRPVALLTLQLDEKVKPLPVDSTFTVRLKGAIGLKYLELIPGRSSRTFIDGATVPVSQTSTEVDLDQFFSMFDPATRAGVAGSTAGYAQAFAGRGSDLNDAIRKFVPLVKDLTPVMRNLSSRQTNLGGFFHGLEAFSGSLVPVAQTQASLYVNLDRTFSALARVAVPSLQDWIRETPPTFSAVIADSPTEQAFLTDTAQLFSELRPGFGTLQQSAPVLADAFAAGVRNLPGSSALDQRILNLAKHLASYGTNPIVTQGLDRLALTASSLRSPLAFLTPVQSSCNYVTLFLRNISNLLSELVGSGTALRFAPIAIDDVQGGESVPSSHPYLTPDTSPAGEHTALHFNPYPNTDSPGQKPECAAGNEPFSAAHALIGNPPGNLGLSTEKTHR